jgi:hypothetical protein
MKAKASAAKKAKPKTNPTSLFSIEKDVPLPKTRSRSEINYPFDELKTGNSFFVPNTVRVFGVVKRACIKWNQTHKNAHLVYREIKDNPRGTRIWKKAV